MKRRFLLLGLGGLFLPAAGWTAGAPVERLVVAGGALTEIVYQLGEAEVLAGVDSTSTFPADAGQLPKIGYLRNLGAEGILSLAPDTLLASADAGPPEVLRQLEAAGVRVEVVPAQHGPAGVTAKIAAVARLLGVERRGTRLIDQFDEQWRDTVGFVANRSGRPRVLFLLAHGNGVQVAGRDTAADAMIRLAGAENVGGSFSGYRPLNGESILAADPQAVLSTAEGIAALGGTDALWRLPGLALTQAGRSRRAFAPDAAYLLSFGLRLPQAVKELAGYLHRPAP